MRFAVLCSPTSWYLRDLCRAAGGRHEIVPIAFRDLVAEAGPPGMQFPQGMQFRCGPMNLRECDAVLVRTMPPGSLEQVVFRMDVLARLEAAGMPVINPARAVEAAVDKYLATAKLQAAGLTSPRTIACQTPEAAMQAFELLGGDVVVKPLFGGEGRGITRLNDDALAERAFGMLAGLGAVLYVQQFIPHDGWDIRVLAVGERMWSMVRRNPLDWRTNVSRGAQAEPWELTPQIAEIAQRAIAAIGAPVAGVDVLPGRDGQLYAIEVNAVPGWQALSRVLAVDIAHEVLAYVESRVRGERG